MPDFEKFEDEAEAKVSQEEPAVEKDVEDKAEAEAKLEADKLRAKS